MLPELLRRRLWCLTHLALCGADVVLVWCWCGAGVVLVWCWCGVGVVLVWRWSGVLPRASAGTYTSSHAAASRHHIVLPLATVVRLVVNW